uniref:WGS project CBMI000000000 data, contig CS3069_c004297 n=1 Tax=Fusarium clavum TaxID=2594811 RepID=A0A090MEJ5_9HYPO|nr:unnamed protein product [Fusarium clavum]
MWAWQHGDESVFMEHDQQATPGALDIVHGYILAMICAGQPMLMFILIFYYSQGDSLDRRGGFFRRQ